MATYFSLHNRSAYSFCSGLTLPGELAAFAAEHDMSAIALTDLNGLYAAVEFQQACRDAEVKPIFGTELVLADGKSVTLLAGNEQGYGSLCRLISLQHLRDGLVDAVDLSQHAPGVICLLGNGPLTNKNPPARPPSPVGLIPPLVRGGEEEELGADGALHDLFAAFGDRLFVELAIHCHEDVVIARRRARWADEAGLPVVATCASRCLRPDQMQTLRALASIGTLTLLNRPHPDKPTGTWHLRTPEEMAHLFRRRPDALHNTFAIAERCDFAFDMSQNRFPAFASPDGRSAMQHLRELCVAGCRRRYVEQPPFRGIGGKRATLDEAIERLERELTVIEQVHYAEYFLVFHEINQYCHGRGIATLARGSAADSLVCYALGVSHACPFRFDLPFDRFLNPERAKFSKMADIDLDLPWDRRDEVVRWVYDRWGHDRVAMIGLPNTFHGRAAMAELGKVFGLPPHEVHEVTKRLPRTAAWNLATALAETPEAREVAVADEPYRSIIRMAGAFEGLPRHWSMHPCGLVVSPEPLTDLVPIQRSAKGVLVSQYDMDAIEALGFIKIDLLGQAGLSVLRGATEEIGRTDGVTIDLERDVDYADEETWAMIAGGEARGVHHIESPAMTSLLRQCDCRDIDCLTSVVAIIRPGAANQGKKEAFARRYQGHEPASFVHPSLEPVLAGTFGLMVFEEHILQVAVDFAGMNLGRADVLRRALNKENRRMIREMRAEFIACARRKGRSRDEIEVVWSQVEGFSGFMFNKAHSAEYAVEAFQGAWLKRRWPAHYLAAVLSNYRGFYAHSPTLPQILYVLEARRSGIGFLPPCVNRSRRRFCIEQEAGRTMIRIPVSHIEGVSQAFLERYHAARDEGAFTDLANVVWRTRPSAAEAATLLDSGAFDGFGVPRPTLFWQLRELTRAGTSRDRVTLWGRDVNVEPLSPPIQLTCPDTFQVAQREMDLLGFPVTIDPLTFLGADDKGNEIDWSGYVPIEQLRDYPGRQIKVCGIMVADRINMTTGGELMKFVTLADSTGFVEAHLFPDVYRQFGHLTTAHPILEAIGTVEPFANSNGVTFRVQQVAAPTRSSVASWVSPGMSNV